jgi:hypothetical protein
MYGKLLFVGVLVLLLGGSTMGCARKTVVVAQGPSGGTYVKVAGGPPAAPKVVVTRPASPRPPPHATSGLMGITCTEAVAMSGSRAVGLFRPAPARSGSPDTMTRVGASGSTVTGSSPA